MGLELQFYLCMLDCLMDLTGIALTTSKLKWCAKCKTEKPATDDNFYLTDSGLYPHCKECKRGSIRRHYADNRADISNRRKRKRDLEGIPESHKAASYRSRLRRVYSITQEDFDLMLTDQGGRCKICFTDTPGGGRSKFSIDHDHVTGKVRGLLCLACNTGLGNFKDDLGALHRAVTYLESAKFDSVGSALPSSVANDNGDEMRSAQAGVEAQVRA